MRDVIRGAKVASNDTMPLPTCGSNLRLSLKYPRGSSVFTSISFLNFQKSYNFEDLLRYFGTLSTGQFS